jgi:S1-C subfamily serine protease
MTTFIAVLPSLCLAQDAARVEFGAADASVVRVFAMGDVTLEHVDNGTMPIVVARPQGGHGTGFSVSEDGLILTAAHVVEGAHVIAVRVPGEERVYPARVVYRDAERDIAVLVTEARVPPLTLREALAVRVRSTVFALGYPIDPRRRNAQSSRGIIAGVLDDGSLQLDIAVNPGNSGGPLLDEADQIIGMVVARGNVDRGVMNIGVAVPIDRLAAAIAAAREAMRAGALPALPEDAQAAATLVNELVHHGSLGEIDVAHYQSIDIDRAVGDRVAALLEGVRDPRVRTVAAAILWDAAIGIVWRQYGVRDMLDMDPARLGEAVLALLRAVARICADVHASDPSFRVRSPFVAFILDYATPRIETLSRGERYVRDRNHPYSGRPPRKRRGFVGGGFTMRFNPDTGSVGYGWHVVGGALVPLHAAEGAHVSELDLALGVTFSYSSIVNVNPNDDDAYHLNLAAEVGVAYRRGTAERQAVLGITWVPGLYVAMLSVDGFVDGELNETAFEALGVHVFLHGRFRRFLIGTGFRMLSGPTIWYEAISLGVTL